VHDHQPVDGGELGEVALQLVQVDRRELVDAGCT